MEQLSLRAASSGVRRPSGEDWRRARGTLAGFVELGYLRAMISWASRYSARPCSPGPQNASSSSGSHAERLALEDLVVISVGKVMLAAPTAF